MKARWSVVALEDSTAVVTYRCPCCQNISRAICIIYPLTLLNCYHCLSWLSFNPSSTDPVKIVIDMGEEYAKRKQ